MEKRVSVKNNAGDCVGEFSDAPAAFGELDALLLYFHKLSTRVRCARTASSTSDRRSASRDNRVATAQLKDLPVDASCCAFLPRRALRLLRLYRFHRSAMHLLLRRLCFHLLPTRLGLLRTVLCHRTCCFIPTTLTVRLEWQSGCDVKHTFVLGKRRRELQEARCEKKAAIVKESCEGFDFFPSYSPLNHND